MRWAGDDEQPQADEDDVIASRLFSMLANGMGGVDWAGLPLAMALHGADDVEAIVHRMMIIKTYKPPAAAAGVEP